MLSSIGHKRYYTIDEVAAFLDVSVDQAENMIRQSGLFTTSRSGLKYFYQHSDLLAIRRVCGVKAQEENDRLLPSSGDSTTSSINDPFGLLDQQQSEHRQALGSVDTPEPNIEKKVDEIDFDETVLLQASSVLPNENTGIDEVDLGQARVEMISMGESLGLSSPENDHQEARQSHQEGLSFMAEPNTTDESAFVDLMGLVASANHEAQNQEIPFEADLVLADASSDKTEEVIPLPSGWMAGVSSDQGTISPRESKLLSERDRERESLRQEILAIAALLRV
jgi:hypothetical protein